jgi:type IV pilus assembly protein PilM
MIQLQRGSRRGSGVSPFTVTAATSRALPDDLPADSPARCQALAAIIREMVREGGFRGREVVSALPLEVIQFKNLRLPPMPARELRTAVEWEAADRLQLDRAKVHLDYFDAGQVRQGEEIRQEIILMAASLADIEQHVQTLLESGLEPLAIDAMPAALARSIGTSQTVRNSANDAPAIAAGDEPQRDLHLIVDIGCHATTVVIVREGAIAFFKMIEVGSSKLEQAVGKRLGMTPDEVRLRRAESDHADSSAAVPDDGAWREALAEALGDLSRELQLCLRYYSVTFRGPRPSRAALVGSAADDARLASVLSEQVGVPFAAASPMSGFNVDSVPQLADSSGGGAWAVAVGLALRPFAAQHAGKAGGAGGDARVGAAPSAQEVAA